MKIKKGVAKRGPKKRKLADLKAQQRRFVTGGWGRSSRRRKFKGQDPL